MADSNWEEEVALGRLIMAKNPGLSPYEAVKQAQAQMLPRLDVKYTTEAPLSPDAEAAFQPGWADRSGTLRVRPEALSGSSREAKDVPSAYKQAWLAGLLGHEVLGHGYDTDRLPGYDQSEDNPHFINQGRTGEGDSIAWLVNLAKQKLKTPQEVQQLRERDIAEAKARGLPYELPSQLKGQ